MDNAEKLEYRLQLLCGYKAQFYANNLKYRVMAKISKTMSEIIHKKAILWADAQLLKEIDGNGYPDINPFLENYVQTFTLFYTPGLGLSEVPKTEEAIEANDANEFYNAIRMEDDNPWYCDTIDEAMFDLLTEKYEIDRTGGLIDQLRDHMNKSKAS